MKTLSAFRSAIGSVKERYSLLTLTVLVIAASVFIYFFYFLEMRADELDKREYRVLNKIESKLRTNLEGCLSLATGQAVAAESQVTKSFFNDQKVPSTIEDTLRAKIGRDPSYLTGLFLDKSFLEGGKGSSGNLVMKSAEILPAPDKKVPAEAISVATRDSMVDSLLLVTVSAPFNMNGHISPHLAEINFNISVGALIRPLLRYDMFDQFMVLKNDTIVYETIATGLKVFEGDTIAGEDNSLKSGTNSVRRVHINGVHYRVYEVGFSMAGERGWSIVGLKSVEKFAAEKRIVPRSYLFAVFILIVFIILAIPFIKSMIMSRTERLGTVDVIFSAISLAVATSVVSILLLDGYMRFDLDSEEQTSQLDDLADTAERNLAIELNAITVQLTDYANYQAAEGRTKKDRDKRTKEAGDERTKYAAKEYPGFNNLFLVNPNGLTMNDYDEPETQFDIKTRKYFSKPFSGECMTMSGVASPFFLDAILSWREQQFRAAVSIPASQDIVDSTDIRVAAMTVRLRAVSNPIHPPGVGFCIFDKSGNVLFHSDSTRSLNENIIEECGNNTTLLGAIAGRTGCKFEEEYAGVRSSVHVRPLRNLPYFIATFANLAPVDAMHGQVFGMAFVLQVLLFLVYLSVIFLGLIITRRKSRLHIPVFSLSLFSPVIDGLPRYVRSIVFNVLHAIVMLITICILQESLSVIVFLFVSSLYTLGCNMIVLAKREPLYYYRNAAGKLILSLYVLLIVVANFVAFNYVDNYWLILFAQILTVCIAGLLSHHSGQIGLTRVVKKVETWFSFKSAYTGVVYVIVLVTCVLPVLTFAILAFNKEKEIEVKTAQLHILNELVEQKDAALLKTDSFRRLAHYYSPFFETVTIGKGDICEASSKSISYFDSFSSVVRNYVQSSGVEFNRLRYGASDSLWTWCYRCDNKLQLVYLPQANCIPNQSAITLVSEVPFFTVPHFESGKRPVSIRFWLLFGLAISGLYFILSYFVKKVFVHEKYSRVRSRGFDQTFFSKQDPQYKVFVTGLPSGGKSNYFRSLNWLPGPLHLVDFMITTPTDWTMIVDAALKAEQGVVLLDHFEYRLLDHDFTKSKLDLIEKLMLKKKLRVVIISSIHTRVFLNQLRPLDGEPINPARDISFYERWSRVLAGFYDFTYPLQGYTNEPGSLVQAFVATLPSDAVLAIPERLINLIEEECNHGMFLRNIGLELLQELQQRNEIAVSMPFGSMLNEREELIIRIQRLCENYYSSIWNHLSAEEQFVLLDLAQDGLVNSNNLDIVENLTDKGLVIYSVKLRALNRSFRNFILSIIEPADLTKIDQTLQTAGNWSKLKLPLFFVLFAMLIFVLKSDGSPLFAVITGFTAIIPIAVTLLGLFGQVKKKE